MTLTELASISQVAAAFGVIVSLLYLAVQVRNGTVTARRAASHDVMVTINPLLMTLSCDRETSSIWMRGLSNFDSLDSVEKVRFSCLMLTITYSWDEAYHGKKTKQLDDWAVQRFTGSMHELCRLPGFKSWYTVRKSWLSQEIREILEREMKLPTPESSLYSGSTSDRT